MSILTGWDWLELGLFAAAMSWLIWFNARTWLERRRLGPMREHPRLPCPHRFVRVRWTVGADGRQRDPQPFCGDCGDPVTTVQVRMRDPMEED